MTLFAGRTIIVFIRHGFDQEGDFRVKVLVIGGTGWVGHHIARKVGERGHEVTILSRGTNGRFPAPGNAKVVKVDKNDADAFRAVLGELDVDAVIDSVPSETCLKVLIKTLGDGIKHYAHCSSTGVYTPLCYVPADENHPWREPTGLNFMHKVKLDALALEAHASNGFPATVIRPTNIMGPGLLPIDTLGGRDPDFLPDVAAGREVFLPNDGSALLQPVFVEDVAEPFALALERPESIGRIYNISWHNSVPLREYLEIIGNALGVKPKVTCLPVDEILARFEKDKKVNASGLGFLCEHMCFGISKAQAELGYEPTLSIEESTRKTIEWWQRR